MVITALEGFGLGVNISREIDPIPNNNIFTRCQNKNRRGWVIHRRVGGRQPEEAGEGVYHVGGLLGLLRMHNIGRDSLD